MPPRLRRRPDAEPLGLAAVAPGSVLLHQSHATCGSDVLIVGDSHTLLCGAQFAYPDCDVDAVVGRTSDAALEVVDRYLQPRHRVLVFEIATNDVGDPPGFGTNLERLRRRADGRHLVLVNTWRRDQFATHEAVNAELAAFHAAHPGETILVDWAAHIDGKRRPPVGPLPDWVHFTPDAYEQRIELVSAAIAEARARVG